MTSRFSQSSEAATSIALDQEDSRAEASATMLSDLLDQDWFAESIAASLDVLSALRFAATCSRARCVRSLPPRPFPCVTMQWRNEASRYSAYKWQAVPLPAQARVHTAAVRCKWHDRRKHGWGNRKGMVSIVEGDAVAPNDYQPWSSGVVAGKEPAPHKEERLELTFSPAAGEAYHVWARAGGGGGHALTVSELEMRCVVYSILTCDEAELLS